MAACDYSHCMDEEGRRQRGCFKHRLSFASPHASVGGRRQDSVSTVRAVRVGHSWLRWDTQLLPALDNLHRRVNRILLYLNKKTELNEWRVDTELRKPGCSQSRRFFSRVRRGGRRWEWELWGCEEDSPHWLGKDLWEREETTLKTDDWEEESIRCTWVWEIMASTWLLFCGEEPGFGVGSRGSTDHFDHFDHPPSPSDLITLSSQEPHQVLNKL